MHTTAFCPCSLFGFLFCNEERSGGSNPLLIPVVVHAHHLSTPQSNQRKDCRQTPLIRPQIENANLRLSQSMRSLNHRHKVHPLLDEIPLGSDGLHAYFVHSYELKPAQASFWVGCDGKELLSPW